MSRRDPLGAAAHAEQKRWQCPRSSRCTRAGRSPRCLESPGGEPLNPPFPCFPRFCLEGFPGALEKRHLWLQCQLLLSALAHPHRCFRDPGAEWLGAGVLMPSLVTGYNWFVSPGEEGYQGLHSPWCRF